jgi:hypothetical protein
MSRREIGSPRAPTTGFVPPRMAYWRRAQDSGAAHSFCLDAVAPVAPKSCPSPKSSARIAPVKRRALLESLPTIALLPAADWLGSSQEKSPPATPVYELRVYHVYEGKLDDLLRRFREHTVKLFEKHGIKNVAYWTPTDEPLKGRTLVYILAHPSREAATANWQAFRDDPEWQSVRDKSEASGKLVEKIDSTFLILTDFSPILC